MESIMKLNEELSSFPVDYNESTGEITVNSSIESEQLKVFLDKLFQFELDNLEFRPRLILKDLSFELKCEAMKIALTRSDLVDQVMILNIFNLVKSWNTFADKYFEDRITLCNSIEEYIDLKLKCKTELNAFKTNVVKFFISALKSYSVTVNTVNLVDLPQVYLYMLNLLSMTDISKLVSDYPVDTKDCGVISQGIAIIDNLIYKNRLVDVIHKNISK